ncbi:MAG TPA: protein phosphatase 2C domain-containing protein [Kofleriaceae bacterium]|nr:protein phosphatase 2C domain-containing protein [Kofleriaceae bacterium]
MKLTAFSLSDTGRQRAHNEDSHLVDGDLSLYAVADGMGGHQGGEEASRIAIDVLSTEVKKRLEQLASAALARSRADTDEPDASTAESEPFDPKAYVDVPTDPFIEIGPAPAVVMRAAARKASSAVYEAAKKRPDLHGMGTTLTAMLFADDRMHIVHAGDSRAYMLRDGKLRQLTEDHSWIQEQVNAGMMTEEEAKGSQFRHIITRSVGFERDVRVDSTGIPVMSGDRFLLCSDGMSNYIENGELERLMGEMPADGLPAVLVELANDRGGDDNITVIVIAAD